MTKTTPSAEATDPYLEIARANAVALTKAAHLITVRGLHKGYFNDPYSIWPNGRKTDARGAINEVLNGDAEECGRPGGDADRISLLLLDHLGLLEPIGGIEPDDQQAIILTLSEWSDHIARTKADVADAMRALADGLLAKFALQN
jgi:hypothetical protein